MKKYLRVVLALFLCVSLSEAKTLGADPSDEMIGTWQSDDIFLGGFTINLVRVNGDLIHGKLTQPGGREVDMGDAMVYAEPSYSVKCGALTEIIARFKSPLSAPTTEFDLYRPLCPNGEPYDVVKVLHLSYDTMTSRYGAKTKDVMSSFTLRFVK